MVFTGLLFNLFMLCLQDLYLTFSCGVCRTSIQLANVVFVRPLFNLFMWCLQDPYSTCLCSVCRTSIQLVDFIWPTAFFSFCVPYRQSWRHHWLSKPCYQYEHRACEHDMNIVHVVYWLGLLTWISFHGAFLG